jgi:hypothetical protein
MISKNYSEHGYKFFKPEISWPAEEPRVTAMELPLVPYLAALFYAIFGFNTFSVRLITVIAFVLLIIYVYKLAKKEAGIILALITAFFTALFPLFSEFGNCLFTEPLLLFFEVFTIYYFVKWIDLRKKYALILYITGLSIVISLKLTSLYLMIPILWIYFQKYRFQILKYWSLIWTFTIAMIIPVSWYVYAYYLSKNYIDVFGVFGGQFGGHNKFQIFTMLSDPDWYKIMYVRLNILLGGKPGLALLVIGIFISLFLRKGSLFFAYFLAILIFFVIVAEGNIDAPYRQLAIIPSASFFVAFGILTIVTGIFIFFKYLMNSHQTNNIAKYIAITILFIILFIIPFWKNKLLLKPDKDIPIYQDKWELAMEIKKYALPSSKLILAGEYTIHNGGNDLSPVTYYYSGLQGWSLQRGEWNDKKIKELIDKGADLLGASGYYREPDLESFLNAICNRYQILYIEDRKSVV